MLPAPLDVLEATLGPAARVVELDDVHVVRTTDRPDHAAGNAVHHLGPLLPAGLPVAIADLDRRFPTGRARLVAPADDAAALLAAAAGTAGLRPSVVRVLRREADAVAPPRTDLVLAPPDGDRAWHGLTVLHRHAAPPGEDRSRGAADDRLRWWVEGLRRLVGQGRARVLLAQRFGTPVGAGVLHWAPGTPVDPDHAGLAVLADTVVHPAHRGLGIGRALAERLVALHRADFPRAAVLGVWEHAGATPPAGPPRGWSVHAELAVLTRDEAGAGDDPGDGPDGVRR